MNFDRFKAHAQTLAAAAKQFQSFDDMAAQDQYIHSDGLNVKSTKTVEKGPTTSQVLESLIAQHDASFDSKQSDSESHRRLSSGRTSSTKDDDSDNHWDQDDSARDDGDDPIMDMIHEKRTLKKKPSDLVSPQQDVQRKSTHRFLDDLDDRLSKPNIDIEEGLSQPVESTQSNGDSDKRWGWIKAAATSRMTELMGNNNADPNQERMPFRSPLSRI